VWGRATRMAAMERFDHILNWKLKRGSHRFPGQDGGTCINEAAIVAIGFPYRPVRSVEDMPDCFSRPICRLALRLNDQASDEERQLLLPFVARLACADTAEVERQREIYISSNYNVDGSCFIRHDIPFRIGLEILQGALAIGRQADALAPEEARTRLGELQQRGFNRGRRRQRQVPTIPCSPRSRAG
jgi:hypothetical protein